MIDEICGECGKQITTLAQLGYMGPSDRQSTECSAFMGYEIMCAECEGSSVVDNKTTTGARKA